MSASCQAVNSAARSQRNNARFRLVAASRNEGATVWFDRGTHEFNPAAISNLIRMLVPVD